VDCIEAWWRLDGRDGFPSLDHLLILADAGGSNGHRCRAWKYFRQHRLCDSHRLTVTVAHYPSCASKWNPIEHRLCLANIAAAGQIVDVRAAAGQTTGDASGLPDGRGGAVGPVRSRQPPPRDSCPAPPVGCTRPFGSTLPTV
jgi:hypothetical protein